METLKNLSNEDKKGIALLIMIIVLVLTFTLSIVLTSFLPVGILIVVLLPFVILNK